MDDEPEIRSGEDFVAARDREVSEARKERARAAGLWRRLQDAGEPRAWRDLVLDDPDFQSWGLCETLCHESAALADEDARRAGELAELALELAPRLSLPKTRHAALQEYVWMHVGNVCRGRGDLARAEEAFEKAKEFFLDGIGGILPGVLDRSRLTALEAAVLRDRGSLAEALSKIDFAIQLSDRRDATRPAYLLERGHLYRRLGQLEPALEALAEAEKLASDSSDPRLLVRIQIELRSALCDLGRYAEIRKLPAAVQKAAAKLPAAQARLLYLEGRAAAGLGRMKEAEAALRKLRADPDRAVGDLALLSLEVAALYARQEQTAELRELAEQTLPLAQDPKLRREAAATLKLFCRLAAQDKMTAERAAQFARDFSRIV
ncbi:MAG TPA: hypothetical protein VF756_31880 [Thermoanaerobaculia bacterium]